MIWGFKLFKGKTCPSMFAVRGPDWQGHSALSTFH
jgi:hypothetical protein